MTSDVKDEVRRLIEAPDFVFNQERCRVLRQLIAALCSSQAPQRPVGLAEFNLETDHEVMRRLP